MDVLLFQTADGGDIRYTNGQIELCGGLETAIYLSWAGGNAEDDGEGDPGPGSWWANGYEDAPARQYRGRLSKLLEDLPLTTANLARFQDAGAEDLAWLTEPLDGGEPLARGLEVTATMPRLNVVAFDVEIDGSRFSFEFRKARS